MGLLIDVINTATKTTSAAQNATMTAAVEVAGTATGAADKVGDAATNAAKAGQDNAVAACDTTKDAVAGVTTQAGSAWNEVTTLLIQGILNDAEKVFIDIADDPELVSQVAQGSTLLIVGALVTAAGEPVGASLIAAGLGELADVFEVEISKGQLTVTLMKSHNGPSSEDKRGWVRKVLDKIAGVCKDHNLEFTSS